MACTTQWAIYHFLLQPVLERRTLDDFLLGLFIFCTGILAAGGFVINDITDVQTDSINKPDRTIIPNRLSIKTARHWYHILLLLGGVIAAYIAFQIDKPLYTLIYVFWAILLYGYSIWWKGTILAGNMLVSFFIASTPAMTAFAEREALFQISDVVSRNLVFEILVAIVLMSFLVNFIREIAKDVDDKTGDDLAGYKTMPVRYGIEKAKKIMLLVSIITIAILVLWLLNTSLPLRLPHIAMMALFVIAPLGIGIQILTDSTHKRTMASLSNLYKWVLFSGLITYITISYSLHHGS